MSIEQVKRTDIRAFLAQNGITPVKETPAGGMYLSPFRKEDTASFHVDYTKNLWYDHGAGVGGSIIDLVMRMYDTDFIHAVRYLQAPDLSHVQWTPPAPHTQSRKTGVEILSIRPLEHLSLLRYIQERGIEPDIARRYCSEVHYRVNGKPYFAVGFRNDRDGWEFRTARFKGGSSPKYITTIDNRNDDVLVFEGFMDLLSYLTIKKYPAFSLNVVVLNSVANLHKAIPFLQCNNNIHLFLDHDEAGRTATAKIVSRCPQSRVIDHSEFYLGYKDVNDYLRAKKRPREKQAEIHRRHVPSVRPSPGKPGPKVGGK